MNIPTWALDCMFVSNDNSGLCGDRHFTISHFTILLVLKM